MRVAKLKLTRIFFTPLEDMAPWQPARQRQPATANQVCAMINPIALADSTTRKKKAS